MTATARKVFDDMARAGVAVDTHVCNAMLHVRLKVGDAARAEALMTRMYTAGVPLDRFSFNTVITLYVRKGMEPM
jgi:pentatricopeptide repeat protein